MSDPPAEARGRLVSLDALRGFALLGILLMNVQSFSMPGAAYSNPLAWGDLTGPNFAAWLGCYVAVDLKFISLFSLLFGAGIALGSERGRGLGGHLRRHAWLAVFGFLHAYLVWYGDILVPYALAGTAVLAAQRLPPRRLLLLGAGVLAVPAVLWAVMAGSYALWPPGLQAEAASAFYPTAEAVQRELAAYRGAWVGQLGERARQAFQMETSGVATLYGWRAAGCMLLGMALLHNGVLRAARSTRFYVALALGGFGLGLPLAGLAAWRVLTGQTLPEAFFVSGLLNYVAAVPVALGWLALVMLACRAPFLARPVAAVAALGRVAFSAYLMQSAVGTLVFYGHGLGRFGEVSRAGQVLFALALWAAQVALALAWLRAFRVGPLEWAWRSLAEGRRLRFRA